MQRQRRQAGRSGQFYGRDGNGFRPDGKTVCLFGVLELPQRCDGVGQAVRYAEAISASSRKLQNVPRLLAQSLDERNDALRSFVAAWTGLEVLVAVTFSTYEAAFMGSFMQVLPAAAGPAAERTREVMATRYRVLDRFVIMASSLDLEGCGPDIKQFETVKKQRDRFVHTMSGEPADLPTGAVQSLLRKYLRLHLEVSSARRH